LTALEDAFRAMALAMEFGFLFDHQRQLLSIGFLLSDSSLDPIAMIFWRRRLG